MDYPREWKEAVFRELIQLHRGVSHFEVEFATT